MSSNKSHCKRGHEFTEDNTYTTKKGARHCKSCRRETMRLRRNGTQVGHANSRKTHCPQGHEYTEENTYLLGSQGGRGGKIRRACKQCAKDHQFRVRMGKYGVTKKWYEEKVIEQQNKCGICSREFVKTPHIDHNHTTGQVRGLLCYSCNGAIGQFQEDLNILKNAIEYLEKFRDTEPVE